MLGVNRVSWPRAIVAEPQNTSVPTYIATIGLRLLGNIDVIGIFRAAGNAHNGTLCETNIVSHHVNIVTNMAITYTR